MTQPYGLPRWDMWSFMDGNHYSLCSYANGELAGLLGRVQDRPSSMSRLDTAARARQKSRLATEEAHALAGLHRALVMAGPL